jgi:hypothetical protein
LRVEVADLNIIYLNDFRDAERRHSSYALGDHGKNRAVVSAAAARLFDSSGLRSRRSSYLPDGADPVAGMHYGFGTLDAAVTEATRGAVWRPWLVEHLFSRFAAAPTVVGVSLMGPSQVFLALVIFALAKELWPASLTVLGGSHATLLIDDITRREAYRRHIDLVLQGHSERRFGDLLDALRADPGAGRRNRVQGSVLDAAPPGADFDYLPLFGADQLRLYDTERLTLPLQFTRGCAYARCTFCTYPVVEPVRTPFAAGRARAAIAALVDSHGIRRFSIKDSLFTAPMMRELADRLSGEGPEIAWSATTKANRGVIRHASKLAAAGLATVEIGVETIHRSGQELFDKRADISLLEDVILGFAESGVTVVVNLIFGLPGERLADAERQLSWFLDLQRRAPAGRIDGSLNMLEIVRGSPLEAHPPPGVCLYGVAPWAYCYAWNAPPWRSGFAEVLRDVELARPRPELHEGPVSGSRRRTA